MCGASYPTNYANQSAIDQTACKPNARESAKSLARLMEKQLGYAEGHIDAIALRLFIRAYWSRVSTFAHAIHDEEA